MNAVLFYRHDKPYREFSNYWEAPIHIVGKVWPTVEHFFQAMKTEDEAEQERIRLLPTPAEAKRAGQKVVLRDGWEENKEHVMYAALKRKFFQHPALGDLLVATGLATLHEDSPSDLYWGARGKDRLGALLMKVRNELRSVKIAEAVFDWTEIDLGDNGVFTGRVPGSSHRHFVVPNFHEDPERVRKMELELVTIGKVEAYVETLERLLGVRRGESVDPWHVFKMMRAPLEARCVAALQVCRTSEPAFS